MSDRLQPLDVSVSGSIKQNTNSAIDAAIFNDAKRF